MDAEKQTEVYSLVVMQGKWDLQILVEVNKMAVHKVVEDQTGEDGMSALWVEVAHTMEKNSPAEVVRKMGEGLMAEIDEMAQQVAEVVRMMGSKQLLEDWMTEVENEKQQLAEDALVVDWMVLEITRAYEHFQFRHHNLRLVLEIQLKVDMLRLE